MCTADRGLCGAFNSSIARLARDHVNRLSRDGKDVKILCVGRKGYDVLRRQFPRQIIDVIELREVRQIGFANADEIGKRVLALFDDGQFDVCTLFFAEFKSVISQVPTAQQLIPAQVSGEVATAGGGAVYEYEPDEESILADLLPRNLSVQIFRALLENVASRAGRQDDRDGQRDAQCRRDDRSLTLIYNRTRQAQITKELIEIISGAEAL